MLFYYDMQVELTFKRDPHKYWTMEEVKQIPLYPVSDETDKLAKDDHTWLWPVHDPCGWSWEHAECKDENEAYQFMMDLFNLSIYEQLNDL